MDRVKGQYKYKNPKERIFSFDKIGDYSSKIKSICDSIVLKYNKIKPSDSTFCEGIVLIYTYFIEGGAIPMALALEEMGFTRYKSVGSVGSKSLFVSGTAAKSNGLHYSLITGNQTISPNNDAEINALRSDKNVDGSVCKVVIISKSASEGVDLKNIRQIHVMDPWYNMSAIEQTIGRGIRTCSHKKLPFDKRNVQIFLHASILESAGFETADLAMYRFSEIKALKIGTISRALKESSVDCILNMRQNEFTAKNLDTEVDLQLSTGGSIRYQIGDKPYTSACDYMKSCNYNCNPNVQPERQQIKMGTFNESFILMNVENIIKVIKQAFREKHFYKKMDLIHFINRVKMYSLLQIHFALTQLIHDKNEYLIDMYGKYGYLLNIGDYYFFQPAELNDPSISIFEKSTPIPFKRDKITLSIKAEDIKKMQTVREEKKEARDSESQELSKITQAKSASELQVENIIASIGYTHVLSTDISLTKKERNDIADAQDPVLKIIPGSIPMLSRDRKWYIYCYEMFEIMKGVISVEELNWYIFVHIMDHLTFEEMNLLVLNVHALNEIANKMKSMVGTEGFSSSSSKSKNAAIKIKIQKNRESVYEKSLEYAEYIIKYFQMFVSKDKDNVLYLFLDSRENVRDISKKIQMYYKKNEKMPWEKFQQEELTSTEYNELKSAFQKSNLAQYVGFMQSIKDGDVVFKIKEGGNRGSVCATSPTMKRTLQDILQFKLTNVSMPSNITQITYCILQEIVLRHYNSVKLNGKVWMLNAVEAIYSI
jgi:hypothetical protein